MVSVIVPVYNEEDSLTRFVKELTSVMHSLGEEYEIIFVDDGSTDESFNILVDCSRKDQKIKLVKFSRNFGKQIAMSAGLQAVNGEAAILLDADLQHPPDLIPHMIKKWQAGSQVVNAVRNNYSDIGRMRIFFSKLYIHTLRIFGDLNIQPNITDFRLLDAVVYKKLNSFQEHKRFLRGLIDWAGFKTATVNFDIPNRFGAKSRFNIIKLTDLAIDGITSFTWKPLRFAFYVGLLIGLCAAGYMCYVLYVRFFTEHAVPGLSTIVGLVLLFGSIQMLFLGLLGEYIGRIYEEVNLCS